MFFSAVRALGRLPARTCAALHDIARVYAGFFFFFFFAHVRTATARYRALTTQFAEILRFTFFTSAVESCPFNAVPLGANSLSIRLWACTFFYSWCSYYTTHLGAVEIAATCEHSSDTAAISTTLGATVPY